MHGGQLQQGNELLVGHMPQKVDPTPVRIADLGANFIGKNSPPRLAFFRPCAVTYIVSADDQYPRLWATTQDIRQRPHENMVAPVRLQVSVDKGDDFVLPGQRNRATTVAIERQGDPRVWHHHLGVNTFMHHRDATAKWFREGAGLPVGGG